MEKRWTRRSRSWRLPLLWDWQWRREPSSRCSAGFPDGGRCALGKNSSSSALAFACHGPDAKDADPAGVPQLAGQNPAYMLQQAMDIKSGARSNGNTAAMKGVMHLVTDEELKAITEWIGT